LGHQILRLIKFAANQVVTIACVAAVAIPHLAADEVTRWNEVATKAALDSGLSGNPVFESRVYALTFAAVHNAVNSIDRRYRLYGTAVPETPNASPRAAVAAAAHDVLSDQFSQLTTFGFSAQQGQIDAAYADALARIPNGSAKERGILVGRAAALAVLELRANDGWNRQTLFDTAYPQGTAPGEYQFTPPNNFAFLANWGSMPPFALRSGQQFRPRPPYAVSSRRFASDYNEIKELGGDGVITPSARTPEQTEIALFWVESSPLMWNRIARTVALSNRLTLWETARLFGLLNLGLADGYIGTFETKYFYKFWRPITAIREGDNDGNPLTTGDPQWTPLVETPPIPDYDSGHAVEAGVGAGILQRLFGTDRTRFGICSTSLPAGQRCSDPSPRIRSFHRFSQAAEENGVARILVGFHFRHAVYEGLAHGDKIADWVVSHKLRAVSHSRDDDGREAEEDSDK
jgi:hypothetical protein